jgi:uncharacterized membrane protein YdbT with pleckstrin-like domain
MLNWIRELRKQDKRQIIIGLIVTILGGLIVSLLTLLSQPSRNLVIKALDKIQVQVTVPFYWLLVIFALGILVMRWLIWTTNNSN